MLEAQVHGGWQYLACDRGGFNKWHQGFYSKLLQSNGL